MDKAEVKQIADFLIEVRKDLCERESEAALRLHLTELYEVIQRLIDATFASQDQELRRKRYLPGRVPAPVRPTEFRI